MSAALELRPSGRPRRRRSPRTRARRGRTRAPRRGRGRGTRPVTDIERRAPPGTPSRVRRKSAAVAPSIARWSQVRVSVIIGRTTSSPSPRTTGRPSIAPTARIAACGGLSTATNCSTPNMPRFEIVNVPPSRSTGLQLAVAGARPTRSARAAAISAIGQALGARITGTTRPGRSRPRSRRSPSGGARSRRRRRGRSPRGGASARPRTTFVRTSVTVGFGSSAAALDEQRPQRLRPGHVRGHRDLEGRRLPRLGQPARDRLAQRRELRRLDLAGGRGRAAGAGAALRRRRARRPRRRSGPRARCRAATRGRCRARARCGARAARP